MLRWWLSVMVVISRLAIWEIVVLERVLRVLVGDLRRGMR